MPTTSGPDIKSVADMIKILTICTETEANAAEAKVCRKPEVLTKLALACGVGTAQVGAGGAIAVISSGALASPEPFTKVSAVAGIGAGIVISAKGAKKAKIFCSALIKHGTANTLENIDDFFKKNISLLD